MAIVYELTEGDVIAIDDGRVLVTVQKKHGRKTKIAVDADRRVSVQCIRNAPTAVQALTSKPERG